jgi:hypothetical protein
LERGDVVGSRSWQFVGCSLTSTKHSSEVTHTAIFVFSVEVLAVSIYGEGGGVLTRSWYVDELFVGVFDFAGKGV